VSGGGAALTARLRIEGDVQDALGGITKTEQAVADLGHAAEGAGRGMELLEAGIALLGLEELAKEMVAAAQAMKGLEAGLEAVAGGASGAQASISFVRAEAQRLGLDIRPAVQSFLDLAGATHGTRLEGQATKDIWDAVTIAGVAMGRSNSQVAAGLDAVTHIASTGVVNMEELRRQMSTAIPGAATIAARALGVTTAQFNQMVTEGKVVASDFLPKFANELKTEFGPTLDKYLNTDVGRARVAMADLRNEIDELQVAGGQEFLAGVVGGITSLDGALTKEEVAEQVKELAFELGQLAGAGLKGVAFLAENAQTLIAIGAGLAGMKLGPMLVEWGSAALSASTEIGVLRAAVSALGGPIAIVAGVGVAAFTSLMQAAAEVEQQTREAAKATNDNAEAMAEADRLLKEAGVDTDVWRTATANAIDPTKKLTDSTSLLADQTIRLGDARRQAALETLEQASAELLKDQQAKEAQQQGRGPFGPLLNRITGAGQEAVDPQVKMAVGNDINGKPVYRWAPASQAIAQDQAARDANLEAQIQLLMAPAAPKTDFPSDKPLTKPKQDRAANTLTDLQNQLASEQALTSAIEAGATATDQWKAADFARQELEKSGLTHKKQLTDAEQAMAARIRDTAEATETAKLANERLQKSADISYQMKQETQALVDQAAAAMQGGTALEDWQVKQAGVQALQQIGVRSLDQLTGATKEAAAAAVADAEAKERQAIATQKAVAVAGVLEGLDRQTKAEQARTLAVQGGIQADADYAKEEAERQALEAAGKNLTDAQVAAIKAKVDALIVLKAANDQADATKQEQKELDLLKLGNDQRVIEERYQKLLLSYAQQGLDIANQEVQARARITATMAQAAADDATAIGNLKDSLEKAFVDTGKLSFDDVGKYAEQQFRKAIYNAFLAKPIDMLVNLVVNSVGSVAQASGLNLGGLGASGLGGLLGSAGIGMAIGGATGLTSGNQGLDLALSLGGSAIGAGIAGSGLGLSLGAAAANGALALGASTGLAGSLGALLTSASVLGPIAAVAALALGSLLQSKPSNNAAISTLDGTSGFTISGDKKTTDTSNAATSASNAVLQGEQALIAAGVTLGTTVSKIDIGTRDLTHVFLSTGEEVRSAVGDPAAAAEAGLDAVLRGATYVSDAEKQMVDSMLDAGKGFDAIETAIQGFNAAQTLGKSISDAIQQITDPEGYAVSQLKSQQAARRAQVQAAADAGYLTADQLSAINAQLTTLEGLELDQTMKQFGDAVGSATDRLNQGQSLQQSVSDAILQITDPTGYKIQQIQEAIDQQRAQATDLLSTGSIDPSIMSQLDTLENLQIGQALQDLGAGVTDAAKAFDDARPKLEQWLDQFSVSSAEELSPQAARAQALSEYQKQLALAQTGDPTALGSITTYADQLETADRAATSSASQRLALAQQIQADITDLTQRTGVSLTSAPQTTTQALTQLVANSSQQLQLAQAAASSGGQAVVVTNLPALSTLFGKALTDQTNSIVAANDQARDAIIAAIGASATQVASAVGSLEAGLANDMAAVGERLDAVVETGQAQVAATGELADQTRVLAAVGAAA
jgi:tape measure domain-containing protein